MTARRAIRSLATDTGHARNYARIAQQYAKTAAADTQQVGHCKWVRLAGQRHLDDLERSRANDWPYRYEPWHANDVCDFIEKLPHIEGVWEKPTIVLEPAQIFVLCMVFGWRRIDTGGRRFTVVYEEVARKNAKSTKTAGVSIYCLACEDEPGAQVLTAATTFDQAKKVFHPAKRMIEKTAALQDAFGLIAWAKSITCADNGGYMQPLHAKSKTQDGHNPHLVTMDELHAHADRGLYDVMRSAFGARKNPLLWQITTAGSNTYGVCYEQRTMATKVLERSVIAEHIFGIIFTLDNDKEIDYNFFQSINHLEENCTCGLAPSIPIERFSQEAFASSATTVTVAPKSEAAALNILNDLNFPVVFASPVTPNSEREKNPRKQSAANGGSASLSQQTQSGGTQPKSAIASDTQTELGQPSNRGQTGTPDITASAGESANTAATTLPIKSFSQGAAVDAKYAASRRKCFAWIIATAAAQSEGYYAPSATLRSAFSEILNKAYHAHSNTCAARSAALKGDGLTVPRQPDDPYDERNWIKANPLLGAAVQLDELRQYAIEAQNSPSAEGEFKTKRLNLWIGAATAWLNVGQWIACGDDTLRLRDFRGLDCYIGTDLSDKDDITAVVLAALDASGRLLLKTWFYLPADVLTRPGAAEKDQQALYRQWKAARKLITTPGDFIDHRVIARKIGRLKTALGARKATGDQYVWPVVASGLNEEFDDGDGFAVILPKNAKNCSTPAKELEARVKAGPHQLRHDANPVMTWMAGNAVVDRRVDGSILPKKEKPMSPNKIDGIDAAVNAIAPMTLPVEEGADIGDFLANAVTA